MIWNLLPRCYIIDQGLEEILLLFLTSDLSKNHLLKSLEQLSINAINKPAFSQILLKHSEKFIPLVVKNINS